MSPANGKNYKSEFGRRIKHLRKRAKMSQDELAEKLGIESGQSFMSKVERGERMLSVENIYKAAEVLDVHPAVLMGQEPLTEDQLEMVVNLFALFKKGDKENIDTVKNLLRTYTK